MTLKTHQRSYRRSMCFGVGRCKTTSGRCKNWRDVEGENKCSGARWMRERDLDNQAKRHFTRWSLWVTGAASEESIPKTSLCLPEQATMASWFPDWPCCCCLISFAVLRQEERNTKRVLYLQLHKKKGPAGKEAWGDGDQGSRKEGDWDLRPGEWGKKEDSVNKKGEGWSY